MTSCRGQVFLASVSLSIAIFGCTGGQETSATPITKETQQSQELQPRVDAAQVLAKISTSIPLYSGASYRDDLTRRDSVMLRNQFGQNAQIYTLASNDSFPQVWHYYVTYLAQYRAYQPPSPYPPENQDWRTIQVNLSQAMRDPFIPSDHLPPGDNTIILQVAETETEPKTLIRYIIQPTRSVAPVPSAVPAVASTPEGTPPAAPGESDEALR